MYTKIFKPLTSEQIKKVNAIELAKKYNVSSSYVSRILKLQETPSNDTAINIHDTARSIIDQYESKSN